MTRVTEAVEEAERFRRLATDAVALIEELQLCYFPTPEDAEGSWAADLSQCDYYRRGLPGADPHDTCSFGCREEPECMTCRPAEGWPSERAAALLARARSELGLS